MTGGHATAMYLAAECVAEGLHAIYSAIDDRYKYQIITDVIDLVNHMAAAKLATWRDGLLCSKVSDLSHEQGQQQPSEAAPAAPAPAGKARRPARRSSCLRFSPSAPVPWVTPHSAGRQEHDAHLHQGRGAAREPKQLAVGREVWPLQRMRQG